MSEYRPQTRTSTTPPWVRHIQGSINDIRKELSALVEIQRDDRKVTYIRSTRLLKKYNIKTKESLDQLTEELKQKVSAKTQQLSRYKKRQTHYQNKLFRTDGKKFYNRLRQPNPNVKMHQAKRKWRTSGEKYMGKKSHIMKKHAG